MSFPSQHFNSSKCCTSTLSPASFKGVPGAEDKELVVGINVGNIAKAYKLEEIQSAGQIKDKIDKTEITLEFDAETDKLTVKDQTGNTLDQMILYWFVWKGIHPDAEVYTK